MPYNRCLVITCKNNTKRTPEKIFVPVPRALKQREVWFKLAHREASLYSSSSRHHLCEDHFDLPKEMINFKEYKRNCGQPVRMIKGCVPRFNLPFGDKDSELLVLQRTSIKKTYDKKKENKTFQENLNTFENNKTETGILSIKKEQQEYYEVPVIKQEIDIENEIKQEPIEYDISSLQHTNNLTNVDLNIQIKQENSVTVKTEIENEYPNDACNSSAYKVASQNITEAINVNSKKRKIIVFPNTNNRTKASNKADTSHNIQSNSSSRKRKSKTVVTKNTKKKANRKTKAGTSANTNMTFEVWKNTRKRKINIFNPKSEIFENNPDVPRLDAALNEKIIKIKEDDGDCLYDNINPLNDSQTKENSNSNSETDSGQKEIYGKANKNSIKYGSARVKKECYNKLSHIDKSSGAEQKECCYKSSTAKFVVECPDMFEEIEVLDEVLLAHDDDDEKVTLLLVVDDATTNIKEENTEDLMPVSYKVERESSYDFTTEVDVEETKPDLKRSCLDPASEALFRERLPPDLQEFDWKIDIEGFTSTSENFIPDTNSILTEDTRPIDVFLNIWDEALMSELVKLTTKGVLQNTAERWRNKQTTNINELYGLFASLLAPELPSLRDSITKSWFRDIIYFLGFSNKQQQNEIQPIVQHLSEKFQSLYNPRRHLCVDKTVIDDDSVAENKTTAYTLCDSASGYVLNIVIGKSFVQSETDTLPEAYQEASSTSPGKIVLDLTSPFFHKGHTIVAESEFSDPLLARCLKLYKTDFFGSLRTVPKSLNYKVFKDGMIFCATSGDLKIMMWNNKGKTVSLISTYHDFCEYNQMCGYTPEMVRDYKHHWTGTTAKNKFLKSFPKDSLQNTQYNKLFIWLLNVSLMNTFLIYKQQDKETKLNYEEFRLRLAKELIEYISIDLKQCIVDDRLRPILLGNHYIVKDESNSSNLCVYCSIFNKQSHTRWLCDTCRVPLCLDCMKLYHTNDKLLKQRQTSTKAYDEFMRCFATRKEQIYKLFT